VPLLQEARYVEARSKLLTFFNGDVRSPPIHYCRPGCCEDSDDKFRDRFCSVVVESGLLFGLLSDFPSKARFGTFGRTSAVISAGVLIHELLPRVMSRAFPDPGQVDADAVLLNYDQDDFRRYLAQKLTRTLERLQDGGKKKRRHRYQGGTSSQEVHDASPS